MAEPKVFSIIALKGGVGKTTLTSNLGAALCANHGKRVLIVDANFSTPHLGIHVGLIDPEKNLHPALNDEYSVHEAIYEHPAGFHVIPGQLAPTGVNHGKLSEVIDSLRDSYDVILIDSSPSLNHEMLAAMNAADEVLVVSSPDYPTLSSTLHAIKIARDQGTNVRGLVVNRVRRKRFELKSKDISGATDEKVLASIPDDVKVLQALASMNPAVLECPNCKAASHYNELAGSLLENPFESEEGSIEAE